MLDNKINITPPIPLSPLLFKQLSKLPSPFLFSPNTDRKMMKLFFANMIHAVDVKYKLTMEKSIAAAHTVMRYILVSDMEKGGTEREREGDRKRER